MTKARHAVTSLLHPTGAGQRCHSAVFSETRAPSPARHPSFALCAPGLLTLLAAFALLPATASADGRIGGANQPSASYLAGGLENPEGLAVSKDEGGDVYVTTGNSNQRIDQFEPGGTFVRAFGWGIVPGPVTGTGTVTAGSTTITNVTTTLGAFGTGAFNGAGKIITGAGIPADTQITAVTSTGIQLSSPASASGTGVALTVAAGPGNVPTNERQSLVVDATGGEFNLRFTSPNPGPSSETTANIHFNAPASGAGSVQEALENLTNIGSGNVSVSEGPGDEKVITFQGRYADTNVRPLSPINVSLSGGSPSSEVTVTTLIEGGGALETCTTVCGVPSADEGSAEAGDFPPNGSGPGQLNYSDEIAIDNDSSSSSYGDVYVIDQRNFRVQKYGPAGEFLLTFGGEVNKTTHANVCTAADLAAGDTCGAGVPGSGHGYFTEVSGRQNWGQEGSNSIAVGPTGTVYVGDFQRVQEFEPDGTYKGQLSLPKAQFISSIAVDASGDVYANSRAVNALQLVSKPERGQAGKGTFTLNFEGQTTAPLLSNASAAEIQVALEALSTSAMKM